MCRNMFVFVIIGVVGFVGCSKNNSVESSNGGLLKTTILITDTLENPASTFYSGDSFYCTLSIVNKTGKDRLYTFGGASSFNMFIDSANSVITNENNGLKIPAIMGTATLKNGDSIVSQWKAPVSLGNVACTLKPGTYTIVPSFLGYTSYERETLQTYTITIVKK